VRYRTALHPEYRIANIVKGNFCNLSIGDIFYRLELPRSKDSSQTRFFSGESVGPRE